MHKHLFPVRLNVVYFQLMNECKRASVHKVPKIEISNLENDRVSVNANGARTDDSVANCEMGALSKCMFKAKYI